MGAVSLIMIGIFAVVMMRYAQPRMATLFAELSPAGSAAITRELDTKGVKYELSGDGAIIRAPQESIARLRMDLAAKGLPAGGSVGYEIFDKTDAFTATATVQNINKIRALEGELGRSIRAIERIQAARVHLSIPERRLFAKDKAEPRASIVLRVRGELDPAQVRAIRHLVAAAVDGLKPARISLVDETGRLLAEGGDEGDPATIAADRQTAHEKRLKAEVEAIVASVVGRGRARVQVAVDLDNQRIQQTSESFDPDGRVVRSTQTRNEQNSQSSQADTVSVANELPGAQKRGDAPGAREQGAKTEEVVNYEISRTTRTETIEAGRIRRLSVAVLVDGLYQRSPAGETTYAPRNDEELQRIAALVRMGVGFDKTRGDQIEVVNLRFAEQPETPKLEDTGLAARLLTFSHDDVMRLSEAAVFVVISLIMLIFIVRPLLRQVIAPLAEIMEPAPPALPGSATAPALPPAAGATPQQPLEQIGQLVAARPAEAAAILKSWMRNTP